MADSFEYIGIVPDSELDNPEGVDPKIYKVSDGGFVEILPNDWVDLNEQIPLDPLWGSSFQVYQCFDDYLTVRMLDGDRYTYIEIAIDPILILNNFRRVKKVYT